MTVVPEPSRGEHHRHRDHSGALEVGSAPAHRVELIGDLLELLVHLEANLLALQDKNKR